MQSIPDSSNCDFKQHYPAVLKSKDPAHEQCNKSTATCAPAWEEAHCALAHLCRPRQLLALQLMPLDCLTSPVQAAVLMSCAHGLELAHYLTQP